MEEAHARKRKRHTLIDSEEEEYHPPGTDAVPFAAESGIDSEGGTSWFKAAAENNEITEREEPKPRGKRGGARPGSGRPRKHPRIIQRPKEPSQPVQVVQPTQPVEQSTQESQLDADANVPAPIQPPSSAPSTPKQNRPNRGHEPEDAIEIEDSEDEDDQDDQDDQDLGTRNRTSRNRRLPAKFREEA
ncbi:hypothetical protein TrVFT333_003133 [Trichoderma virens FT-333]|nr:hypothetical protein TrVFT333_003133 [Trichoderma virens FT-333]